MFWKRRKDRRRAEGRAFRPGADHRLESKQLLTISTYIYPPNHIQTAYGGSAVDITTPQGQGFYIGVTTGQIRAYDMGGGRYGLILSGTNAQSDLTINPVLNQKAKQTAHKVNPLTSGYTGLINIGAITVTDGTIGLIEGYKTAILSGPIVATSANPVQRIAFDQIVPGASITVGGDLNDLDIFNTANFSGAGTGITVGRDFNFLSDNGNLVFGGGANLVVGRDIALSAQAAQGTGPAGQGFAIQGNFVVGTGSLFVVGRAIDPNFQISTTVVTTAAGTQTLTGTGSQYVYYSLVSNGLVVFNNNVSVNGSPTALTSLLVSGLPSVGLPGQPIIGRGGIFNAGVQIAAASPTA